mmetsp:Transcript_35163/g.79647  ORF Transcript_35163/g.79647 Transcript_35163/m.79647 type:complete len:276 (+) Transcript_35163:234-1061(+)
MRPVMRRRTRCPAGLSPRLPMAVSSESSPQPPLPSSGGPRSRRASSRSRHRWEHCTAGSLGTPWPPRPRSRCPDRRPNSRRPCRSSSRPDGARGTTPDRTSRTGSRRRPRTRSSCPHLQGCKTSRSDSLGTGCSSSCARGCAAQWPAPHAASRPARAAPESSEAPARRLMRRPLRDSMPPRLRCGRRVSGLGLAPANAGSRKDRWSPRCRQNRSPNFVATGRCNPGSSIESPAACHQHRRICPELQSNGCDCRFRRPTAGFLNRCTPRPALRSRW